MTQEEVKQLKKDYTELLDQLESFVKLAKGFNLTWRPRQSEAIAIAVGGDEEMKVLMSRADKLYEELSKTA